MWFLPLMFLRYLILMKNIWKWIFCYYILFCFQGNKIRVTILDRNTKFRNILNQNEVILFYSLQKFELANALMT